MRDALTRAFAVTALMIAGCAGAGDPSPTSADGQAGLASALAGFAPGKPMACSPAGYSRLVATAYGRTLLYRDANSPIFRTDTTGGCERAGHGDVLISVQLQDHPCRGDIIHTADSISRTPTGSCTLGDFVRYTKVRSR